MGDCVSKDENAENKEQLETLQNNDTNAPNVSKAASKVIFNPPDIFLSSNLLDTYTEATELNENNIKECLPVQRIKYIFQKYITLTEEKECLENSNGIYSFINNKLGEAYNNTQLLNDFHFILSNHDSSLSVISDFLANNIRNINLSNLSYFHRNYRDRFNNVSTKNVYDIFDNDPKEINTVQILDKIYCYLLYTLRMGHRLSYFENDSKKETLKDAIKDNAILKLNKMVKNNAEEFELNGYEHMKYKYYINMGANSNEYENKLSLKAPQIPRSQSNASTSSQLSTSLDMMIDRIQTRSVDYTISSNHSSFAELPDIDELNQDGGGHKLNGSFQNESKRIMRKKSAIREYYTDTMVIGYRYYYWPYFKEHKKRDENNPGYKCKDWYVECKYDSLKTELLSNINCLNIQEYEEIYCKGSDIVKSDYAKSIVNNYYWYTREYGLKEGTSITLQHIIAVAVYCNFYNVQNAFNNTFYRTSPLESDEMLKQRHGLFGNLGRLLRETVECFGQEITSAKSKKFYSIIPKNMFFSQTNAKICIPLCCSSNNSVILNYMNNNNEDTLLLQLEADHDHVSDLFDCSFISDFANENQVLFIGGFERIKFDTVIDVDYGLNYQIYLKAINTINYIIKQPISVRSGMKRFNENLTFLMKEVILTLFENELKRVASSDSEETPIDNAYSDALFRHFCFNVFEIRMNLNEVKSSFAFLCSLFGINQDLEIGVLFKLFPNAIDINLSGITKLSQKMMDQILKMTETTYPASPGTPVSPPVSEIGKRPSSTSKIVLKYMNVSDTIVHGLIGKYSNKFQENTWKMTKKYRSVCFEKIQIE